MGLEVILGVEVRGMVEVRRWLRGVGMVMVVLGLMEMLCEGFECSHDLLRGEVGGSRVRVIRFAGGCVVGDVVWAVMRGSMRHHGVYGDVGIRWGSEVGGQWLGFRCGK